MSECSVDGCVSPAKVRGWCRLHYGRVLIHGNPHVVKKPGRVPGNRLCSVEGCERPHASFDYCSKHLYWAKKNGHPLPAPQTYKTGCEVDGCDQPHSAHGYCRKHWYRMQKHGDPHVDGRRVRGLDGGPIEELLDHWIAVHGDYQTLVIRSGLSRKTFARVRRGGTVSLDVADKILTAMHRSIDEVYGLDVAA